MSSDCLAENTNQAAAFNTDWSRSRSDPEIPASTVLHQSTLLMTSAQSSVSRAFFDSERRTLRICRSAAKQALTVALTWVVMVRSVVTPIAGKQWARLSQLHSFCSTSDSYGNVRMHYAYSTSQPL